MSTDVPRGAAAACAVVSALLFVGAVELWPLALVALIPLYLMARGASFTRALALGWLFGFVVNLVGHTWGVALLGRLAHLPAPAGAAVVIAIAAYQACVPALWLGFANLIQRRVSWLVAAPLCVVLAESAVPFVFPWYLAIGVWRAWPLLQPAELGGPPAVSALLVLINLLAAELLIARIARQALPRAVRAGGVVVLALIGLGLLRAGHVAWARHRSTAVKVGVVQPNFGIVPVEARRQRGEDYLAVLRRATEQLGDRGASLVVWPESSFPFVFDRRLTREYAPSHPWQLRGRYQGAIFVGALTHDFDRLDELVFNSAVLVGAGGEVRGIYDKNQLLAFGEYIPFEDRFPAWAARVRARMPESPAIEPGRAPAVLADGELRIAPLICYEDILPGFAPERSNLLVTLANHAWFGTSAAPELALALSTLRSVESRRDLVRAANTGISSFTDALGRVTARTRLVEAGPPELLVEEVRLVDSFALGPWTIPLFPFACALALLVLLVGAPRRRDAS